MISVDDYNICLSVAKNVLRRYGLNSKNLEHAAQDVALRIIDRDPDYITAGYVKLYCKEFIAKHIVEHNEREITCVDLEFLLSKGADRDFTNEPLDTVRHFGPPETSSNLDFATLLKLAFPERFHDAIDEHIWDIRQDFIRGSVFSSLAKYLNRDRKEITRYLDKAYYNEELRELYEQKGKSNPSN